MKQRNQNIENPLHKRTSSATMENVLWDALAERKRGKIYSQGDILRALVAMSLEMSDDELMGHMVKINPRIERHLKKQAGKNAEDNSKNNKGKSL